MPAGAVAQAGSGAATAPAAAMNPFWVGSNWYFEPNSQEILGGSWTMSGVAKNFSVQLDTNGFLRDYRINVRGQGAVGGTPTPDGPAAMFQNLSFQTPNGSEFFQPHPGYYHLLYQAYGRPWEGDPTRWEDYAASINPSMTLKLSPEIRYTAGVLANMDSRRQYKVSGQIGPTSSIVAGANTTPPTLNFSSGIDTWAQPDEHDLADRPNEALPPGVALQTYRRFANQVLNGPGASNTMDARSLTGNQQRLMMLVVRDNQQNRQDYLSDPITYTLDTRLLGNFTQNAVFGQMREFYGVGMMPRPVGVYVFPRFFNPGTLVGTGWLETNGATKQQWQSSTVSTATGTPGTVDILVEDVVPLRGLPYELTNL